MLYNTVKRYIQRHYRKYAMAKRKPIMLTEAEHRVLVEATTFFRDITRADISYGAFITLLCFGVLMAKVSGDVGISCPKCGYRAELTFVPYKGTRA